MESRLKKKQNTKLLSKWRKLHFVHRALIRQQHLCPKEDKQSVVTLGWMPTGRVSWGTYSSGARLQVEHGLHSLLRNFYSRGDILSETTQELRLKYNLCALFSEYMPPFLQTVCHLDKLVLQPWQKYLMIDFIIK